MMLLRSCSSCSNSSSRTSTWKCSAPVYRQSVGYLSCSSEVWYAQCKLCRKKGDSRGAVLLEVVEKSADVSTTGVQTGLRSLGLTVNTCSVTVL